MSGMIFCSSINNLAYCLKGERNGSVVPATTKELHAYILEGTLAAILAKTHFTCENFRQQLF